MNLLAHFPENSIICDYIFQRLIRWTPARVREIERYQRQNRLDKFSMVKMPPLVVRLHFAKLEPEFTRAFITFFEFGEKTGIQIHGKESRMVSFDLEPVYKLDKEILIQCLNQPGIEELITELEHTRNREAKYYNEAQKLSNMKIFIEAFKKAIQD